MNPTCSLCHGNAGRLNAEGKHNLCDARAAIGLPTPSLGTRCETCGGRGTLGTGGVFLDFNHGPATIARSIAAQFPPCPDCGGKGYTTQGADGQIVAANEQPERTGQ